MPVAEKNLLLQQKIHVGFKVFYILDEEIRADPVLVDKKRERILFSPSTSHLAVGSQSVLVHGDSGRPTLHGT